MERELSRLILITGALVLIPGTMFISGCQSIGQREAPALSFRAVSALEVATVKDAVQVESEEKRVSMAAAGLTVGEFFRSLALEHGVSVVWAESLDASVISMEVAEVPVSVAVEMAARRVGAEVLVDSGVFYVGTLDVEDNAFLTRRVGRVSQEELQDILGAIVRSQGGSVVLEDGLIVVSDRVSSLRKVGQVLDQVESMSGGGWLVQLLLVEQARTDSKEYGIDSSFDIEVASVFAAAAGEATGTEVLSSARAALKADVENERVRVYAQPLFTVRDGGTAVLKRGQVVPVPEFTTLETGAVVTSGYSEIEIGFQVTVGLRAAGPGAAVVDYDLSLGEIVGFVDERVPVRTEEELTGAVEVLSGGTYLLGSLERGRDRDARTGVLQLGFVQDREETRLEVWCMAVEVGRTNGGLSLPGNG